MTGKKGRSGRPKIQTAFKKIPVSFSLSFHTISLLNAELKRLGWAKYDRNKYVDLVLSRTLMDAKKRALIQMEISEKDMKDAQLVISQLKRREEFEKNGLLN